MAWSPKVIGVDSLRHPVGPRSPQVYWLRRAVVLAIVILAVFLITRACGAAVEPDSGQPGAQGSPAPITPRATDSLGPGAGGGNDYVAPPPGGQEPDGGESGAGEGSGGDGSGAGVGTDDGAGTALTPGPSPTVLAGAQGGGCARGELRVEVTADQARYGQGEQPEFKISVANLGDRNCEVNFGRDMTELLVTSGRDRVWSSDDCESHPRADARIVAPGETERRTRVWHRVRSAEGCPAGLPEPQPGTYVLTATIEGLGSDTHVFMLTG
ncbi:MAG: hypothetical protein ACRDPK_12710 [Carbonactinosporaceae bacterium]